VANPGDSSGIESLIGNRKGCGEFSENRAFGVKASVRSESVIRERSDAIVRLPYTWGTTT
jgi:hypothetical protein